MSSLLFALKFKVCASALVLNRFFLFRFPSPSCHRGNGHKNMQLVNVIIFVQSVNVVPQCLDNNGKKNKLVQKY